MKRLLFAFVCVLSSIHAFPQYSKIYASENALFADAMELYEQQKYSASFRSFEAFLEQLPADETVWRERAAYFLCANAYELRRTDAMSRLQEYKQQFPYSSSMPEVRFMLGVLYTEKGRYKLANREFSEVGQKYLSKSHQADYLFHKGYVYVQLEDYENAALTFQELIKAKTRYDAAGKYYYAYCRYEQQDYAEALPYFLELEQHAAYKSIVPYYVIQIYYAEQAYDEVLERAENILSQNPDNEHNSEIHRILGEIYFRKSDYAQTIQHLSAYVQAVSQAQREDLYLLGLAYYQTTDYTNAVKYLSRVTTEADMMSENAYLHLGFSYIRLGDLNNARLAFGAATRTTFDVSVHEEAMYNYALTTYETTAAFGESVTAFSDFLKQYPNSVYADKAYAYLIDVFMSTKDYRLALNALSGINDPGHKLMSAKRHLLYHLGTEAYAQNNFEEAVRDFTEVLETPGTQYSTESLFWRSESYYRLKNYAACRTDLQNYFAAPDAKKSPNYALAYYSAGYACFALKDYAQAQKYFLTYLSLQKEQDNTYIDALNRIGDTYFYVRNFAQADAYYAKVVAAGSVGTDYAMFQRGYVLGLLKKYDDKIVSLEKLAKDYPKSEYADDALYEIARAHLMVERNQEAIAAYNRLLHTYPNSGLARKTALEIGMVYYNMKEYDSCIEAYKQVIANYPGSEESYVALDGLQSVYVELNQVSEYLAYVNSLGRMIKIDASKNQEDSLTYMAAEHQYVLANYEQAAPSLEAYLEKFCPGGRYCLMARYYLADSYYKLNEKTKALDAYRVLTEVQGNQYMEEACMRCAEICYDQEDYAYARTYFQQLQTNASSIENINTARLGILRCCNQLDDYEQTVNIATQILDDIRSNTDVCEEARYNRAKAYLKLQKYEWAISDLETLATDLRTEAGAEAKYLLAETYFVQGDLEESEQQIMDFAEKNTPHQFWLARSFVLLADIYMKKGDDFQAKQYLLSVQNNYNENNEIQQLITERLELIANREQERID